MALQVCYNLLDACLSERKQRESMKNLRWTSHDLELLPEDKRYEIVDGELYVSKQPHLHHQIVCGRLLFFLEGWSNQTQLGMPIITPGLIFADMTMWCQMLCGLAINAWLHHCGPTENCILRQNWLLRCFRLAPRTNAGIVK